MACLLPLSRSLSLPYSFSLPPSLPPFFSPSLSLCLILSLSLSLSLPPLALSQPQQTLAIDEAEGAGKGSDPDGAGKHLIKVVQCGSFRLGNLRQQQQRMQRSCAALHTSAYVSIRQQTSAYVSRRQHTSAYVLAICASNSSACSEASLFFQNRRRHVGEIARFCCNRRESLCQGLHTYIYSISAHTHTLFLSLSLSSPKVWFTISGGNSGTAYTC